MQQLEQPFLYNGFAIAAGDPDNGNAEMSPVKSGQLLQGSQAVINQNHIRSGQ